jgi:hypothetical protein
VRALLEPLREIADEIVVAVDSAAGESELPQYAAVADRVLRFERGPSHSALSWLHAQCRGDWVFLIAGDEVASPALLEALPDLIGRREALQYSFPVRWLWPDEAHWLASPPWEPDFHARLVRNDATLRFDGLHHALARPTAPAGFVDAPIWHLSLLALDEAQRREKIVRYEAERSGLLAPGGRPLNSAYYLPEEASDAVVAPVPAAAVERIRAVMHAEARPAAPAGDVPLHTRAEIEPLWAQRTVGSGAHRATVSAWLPSLTMVAGERRDVFVRARNEGDARWTWGFHQRPYFRLGFRWVGTDVEGRAAFTHDVEPGAEAITPVPVVAPEEPGSWTLEIGMLHEDVCWFGTPCRLSVDVVSPVRAAPASR